MLIAFDIETSVRTGEPACLTWCVAEHGADGTWRPGPKMGLHARDPKARATFAAWLADESVVLLGQNVAFDMVTLSRWWGLLPEMRRAYEAGRVRDTMLRQHLIDIAWPAKPNVVWNDELGKFFPGKLAWHRGLGKMIRIDAGENEDGGGAGALDGLRAELERLGDSVAIAASAARSDDGDSGRHSVHVHTDDAGAAIEAGLAVGALSRIQISALNTGPGRPAAGSWSRERAVLAVVDGDGAEELFGREGADVLRPEPESADPGHGVSARQLLRALVDTGAAQVMVLPNGYVAAEELVAGCTAGISTSMAPARFISSRTIASTLRRARRPRGIQV